MTNISYELAKELRDARFPQNIIDSMTQALLNGEVHTKVTIPTLSELIEACGYDFSTRE